MPIREYNDDDFEALQSIYNTARPDEFYAEKGSFKFTPLADDEYIMFMLGESEVFVYEQDSILGFCGFTGNRINWLFVDPSSRGNGVGNKLLQYVLQKLDKGATLSVWKSNQRAQSLYKKLGFRISAEFQVGFQGHQIMVNTMVYP